jgi:hypothetical protein
MNGILQQQQQHPCALMNDSAEVDGGAAFLTVDIFLPIRIRRSNQVTSVIVAPRTEIAVLTDRLNGGATGQQAAVPTGNTECDVIMVEKWVS